MAEPAPASVSVRVGMAGDTYVGGSMDPLIQKEGMEAPCAGLKPVLDSLDVFVVNLETSMTRGGNQEAGKTFTFRMRPEALAAVQACGVDGVNLANNHTMDYGAAGLEDTLLHLKAGLLGVFGAGMDLAEARKPWVVERNGVTIAFLGYSRTLPRSFWAGVAKAGSAPAYEDMVAADVEAAKKTADHVFVSFHWGEERNPVPRSYQENLARLAIDKGASLVFGHHPHIVQPVEIYKGRPILYSLGNFAFASYNYNSELAFLAEALLSKERIEKVLIHPLDVYAPRTGFRIVKMPVEAALPLIEGMIAMDGPDHRTVMNLADGTLEIILSTP